MQYEQIKIGLAEMWDAVLFLPNDDPTKQSAIVDAAEAEAKAWDQYRREITMEQLERERNRLVILAEDTGERIYSDQAQLIEKVREILR